MLVVDLAEFQELFSWSSIDFYVQQNKNNNNGAHYIPKRSAISLRGRRPKGRERGKTSATVKREKIARGRIAVGDACRDAIVFFIPPSN